MNDILIVNGIIVSDKTCSREDLIVEKGLINAIGAFDPSLFAGFQVIDAMGKYVIPGGFDPHVHLSLPTPAGKSCDDFRSGSWAALTGGTTSIMDFVTPVRGQSLLEALALRRTETSECRAECGLHMGISEWNPKVAAELVYCIQYEGIKSFKTYLAYNESIGISEAELQQVMNIVGPAGGLVMVHCEDGGMIDSLRHSLIRDGKVRPSFHAGSRPPEAEIRAIGKVLELSAKTGCPVYIVHISTRKGAETVAAAKRSGIRVYGETCPHYLLFDDSVYSQDHSDTDVLPFIISPPIRGKHDQEGLWEAIIDGTIDVVATDHCPFDLHGQKDKGMMDFTKIPNGTGSIEHRLSLLYTYGVLTNRITFNQFVSLISTRPAEIFGMGHRKGKLLPGYDADIVIWDPDYTGKISSKTHISRCDHDIYEGITVHGKPEVLMVKGNIVNL